MPAHDADHEVWVDGVGRVVQGIGDRVVVQGAGQLAGQDPRPVGSRPGVDHRVGTGAVVAGTVELVRVVQPRPVRVEGHLGQLREEQRAALPQPLLDGRGESAAQEDRTPHLDPEQVLGALGQVERGDEPAVQAASTADVGVEVGKGLDLERAAARARTSSVP